MKIGRWQVPLKPAAFIASLWVLSFLANKMYVRHPYAGYGSLAFDDQNLALWELTARQGLRPLLDVFFPYGLLRYYHNVTWWLRVFYVGIFPLYLSIFFIIVQREVKRFSVAGWSTFLLFLFLQRFTGLHTFVRYGALLVAPLVAASLQENDERLSLKLLIFGTCLGTLITLITDQGVYGTLAAAVTLGFGWILGHPLSELLSVRTLKEWVKRYLYFLTGVGIGAAPILLLLLWTDAFPYVQQMSAYMKDLELFAKLSIGLYLRTPSNIFTFAVLAVMLNLVAMRAFFFPLQRPFFTRAFFGLCIGIVLVELKSIVRNIDWQILPLSFTLVLLLLVELSFQFKKMRWLILLIGSITVLSILRFPPFKVYYAVTARRANFDNQMNINLVNESEDDFGKIRAWARINNPQEDAIFAFPGDPLLYQIFEQQPPYYPDLYSSSPDFAQRESIRYLQERQVRFLIFHPTYAIQDGVPDYLRGTTIFPYLFTRFKPLDTAGAFLIFERSTELVDFFIQKDERFRPIQHWLLNAQLGAIPASEGKKYTKTPLPVLAEYQSSGKANAALERQPLDSTDMGLVLTFKSASPNATVKLTTPQATTAVSMTDCGPKLCIVNLARLPLFYLPRSITKIETQPEAEIMFIKIPENSNFW